MESSIFRQLQEKVCETLNADSQLSSLGVTVISEDQLDADFQIRQAMQRQGMCVMVMFGKASWQGWTGESGAWTVEDLTVQTVENPSVWRAWLKKNQFQNGTTTDVLARIADVLGGTDGTGFGKFNPKSVEIGEDSDLVVGKAVFSTTVHF